MTLFYAVNNDTFHFDNFYLKKLIIQSTMFLSHQGEKQQYTEKVVFCGNMYNEWLSFLCVHTCRTSMNSPSVYKNEKNTVCVCMCTHR